MPWIILPWPASLLPSGVLGGQTTATVADQAATDQGAAPPTPHQGLAAHEEVAPLPMAHQGLIVVEESYRRRDHSRWPPLPRRDLRMSSSRGPTGSRWTEARAASSVAPRARACEWPHAGGTSGLDTMQRRPRRHKAAQGGPRLKSDASGDGQGGAGRGGQGGRRHGARAEALVKGPCLVLVIE